MYKYDAELHTSPVSKCARVSVGENLEFYKSMGYDGVFITNHFLDGNANIDRTLRYEDNLKFYLSDYEEGKKIGEEIGIKVFFGVEMSYKGTDFLVYGLDGEWYMNHPEIMDFPKKSGELTYLAEHGAFIVQAHPYREAGYIDHIRLFPRHVHGCEVVNACQSDFVNNMADIYAESYGLIKFAGSDNHVGGEKNRLAGMESEIPVTSEAHFIELVKSGQAQVFRYTREI